MDSSIARRAMRSLIRNAKFVLIVLLCACTRPPKASHCADDGSVTPDALKTARKLTGIDLGKATQLYCVSTEPTQLGAYEAWLTARLSHWEFEEIVSHLGVVDRSSLNARSPVRTAAPWSQPANQPLPFWPDELETNPVFVSELGELGLLFVGYSNGVLYYHADVDVW